VRVDQSVVGLRTNVARAPTSTLVILGADLYEETPPPGLPPLGIGRDVVLARDRLHKKRPHRRWRGASQRAPASKRPTATATTSAALRLSWSPKRGSLSGRPGPEPVSDDAIYKAMSAESKYPDELFAGSPDTIEALKSRITASLGGASF